MNDFRRGLMGGLVAGVGGTLAVVFAALAWIAWEDLK